MRIQGSLLLRWGDLKQPCILPKSHWHWNLNQCVFITCPDQILVRSKSNFEKSTPSNVEYFLPLSYEYILDTNFLSQLFSQFIQRRVSEYQLLSTNIVYVLWKITCPDQILLRSKSNSKKSTFQCWLFPPSYWREISVSQLYSIRNLFKEDSRNINLSTVHRISNKTYQPIQTQPHEGTFDSQNIWNLKKNE